MFAYVVEEGVVSEDREGELCQEGIVVHEVDGCQDDELKFS